MVHTVKDHAFSGRKQRLVFLVPPPRKEYDSFTLRITATAKSTADAVQFADLDLMDMPKPKPPQPGERCVESLLARNLFLSSLSFSSFLLCAVCTNFFGSEVCACCGVTPETVNDAEGPIHAFDGKRGTKWHMQWEKVAWGPSDPVLILKLKTAGTFVGYNITSADDFEGRDPKDW